VCRGMEGHVGVGRQGWWRGLVVVKEWDVRRVCLRWGPFSALAVG